MRSRIQLVYPLDTSIFIFNQIISTKNLHKQLMDLLPIDLPRFIIRLTESPAVHLVKVHISFLFIILLNRCQM
jgi:hypothetical protein